MPIGTGIVYNTGDLILSQVSSSGTAFLETKIAAATSSLIYFDSTARINSASLNSITVGTASYVSGSNSIITNLTASNISASGTSSFGYVGIGTTSPIQKLDVRGDVYFTGSTLLNLTSRLSNGNAADPLQVNSSILLGGAGGTYTFGKLSYDTSNNTFNVIANANPANLGVDSSIVIKSGTSGGGGPNEIARFVGNGNVGIGTTSPSGSFHIYNSTSYNAILETTTANNVQLRFRKSGTDKWSIYVGNSSNDLTLWDGTSDRVTFQNGGNVGIGTSSPASLLSVQGDINSNYNSSGTSRVWRTFATNHASGNRGAIVLFGMYDGSPAGMSVVNTSSSNPSYNSQYLTFLTHEGAVSADERMRITPLGNVGIGTTNPIYLLDVYGSIRSKANTATGTILLGETSGGTSYVAAALIGTPSPAYNPVGKLSIQIPTHGIGTDYGLTEQMSIQVTGPDTKSGTIILLPNSGYVGIGTTSPAYLLDVSGSTRHGYRAADNHYFTGSVNISGGLSLTNLTASNISASGTGSFGAVGIGTSAIDAKLTILGTSTQGTAYTAINLNNTDRGGATIGFKNFTDSAIGTLASISVISEDVGSGNYNDGVFTISTAADTTNSERFRITSRGQVGIGTTNPDIFARGYGKILGISGSTAAIELDSISGTYLDLGVNGTRIGGLFASSIAYEVGTPGNFPMHFYTSGSYKMSVLVNGNVGIGTTLPNSKLEVAGASGTAIVSIHNTTLGRSGSFGIDSNGVYIQNSNNGDYFDLKNASGVSKFRMLYDSNTYITTTYTSVGSLTASGSKLSVFGNLSIGSSYGFTAAPSDGAIFEGNVGIGTTLPQVKLQVVTDASTPAAVPAAGTYGGAAIFGADLRTYGLYVGAITNGNGYVQAQRGDTATTYNLLLQPNGGNVGIGTTSPVNKLQVAGNISGSSFTSSISNAVGFLGTSSWAQNVVSASYATTAQTANALNASNTYTVAGLTSAYVDVTGAGTIPTTGIYRPSTKTLGLSADGTLIFKISNVSSPATSSIETGNFIVSGSVGIGTTSPSAKLTIVDNTNGGTINLVGRTSDDTAAINFRATGDGSTYAYVAPDTNEFRLYHNDGFMSFYPGGSEKVRITSAGNVGIGTTSPNAKLQISGSSANLLTVGTLTNDWGGVVAIGTFDGNGIILSKVNTTNDANRVLTILRDDTNGATIAGYTPTGTSTSIGYLIRANASSYFNGGNVGIGTVTPTAKLEITGSSNSALLNIKSPISGAILYVSGSGAVGIGDSNVGTYRLYVSGSFGATTKSFIIDHPTKAGKKLIYGSLESPYHGIRLTGRDTLVNGKCKVELPEYIYKLILHDSVNIQLTGIKCNKTLYVDEINIPENYFTIAYDKAIFESYKDYDFFWDFTAIRADVPELITEL